MDEVIMGSHLHGIWQHPVSLCMVNDNKETEYILQQKTKYLAYRYTLIHTV